MAFLPFEVPDPYAFTLLKMAYKPQMPDFLWASYFLLSTIHLKLNLFLFPVNLSYVNLIIRSAKEPRRVEGKCLLPFTYKQNYLALEIHLISRKKHLYILSTHILALLFGLVF